MFILSFPLFVLLICYIAVVAVGSKYKDLPEYLNIGDGQTNSLRFVLGATFVSLGFQILGLFFAFAISLGLLFSTIASVLAWWWLFETFQSGKIKIWYKDAKAYFEQD